MACSLILQWLECLEMPASFGVYEAQAQGALLSTHPTGFSWASLPSPAVTSGTQESKIHESSAQTKLQSRDAPALNLHSGHGLQVNDAFCTGEIRAACLPRDAFTSLYPTSKGTAPVSGTWLCCWGENPWVTIKAFVLLTATHPLQTFLLTVSD